MTESGESCPKCDAVMTLIENGKCYQCVKCGYWEGIDHLFVRKLKE